MIYLYLLNLLDRGHLCLPPSPPSLSLHYTCIDVHSSSVDDVKCIKVDPITTADVITAISHTKPSSATGLNNKYTSWQKQYESY